MTASHPDSENPWYLASLRPENAEVVAVAHTLKALASVDDPGHPGAIFIRQAFAMRGQLQLVPIPSPHQPPSRDEEILLVVVNDAALHNDAVQIRPLSPLAAFGKYAPIVQRVALQYRAKGWPTFTLREMADAIVLLDEHFRKEDEE